MKTEKQVRARLEEVKQEKAKEQKLLLDLQYAAKQRNESVNPELLEGSKERIQSYRSMEDFLDWVLTDEKE
jgi:hypothetical protein